MWVNHALIRYQQVTLPPANLTWYINQKPVSESHQSPLSRISSSSPNHLRINHFGNHCNPQAAPSQVTLYPVRNISRCALAKSEELIEVSSCLSKYLLVYRSIFLLAEVRGRWSTRPRWACSTGCAGWEIFLRLIWEIAHNFSKPRTSIMNEPHYHRKDFLQGRERLLRIKCVASIYDAYYKVRIIC